MAPDVQPAAENAEPMRSVLKSVCREGQQQSASTCVFRGVPGVQWQQQCPVPWDSALLQHLWASASWEFWVLGFDPWHESCFPPTLVFIQTGFCKHLSTYWLLDAGALKSLAMIKTLNFQRANFHFFKGVVDRMPWKLPSGIMELNRAGTHLKTFFLENKNSQFPFVRSQTRKAGEQLGRVRFSLFKMQEGNMQATYVMQKCFWKKVKARTLLKINNNIICDAGK